LFITISFILNENLGIANLERNSQLVLNLNMLTNLNIEFSHKTVP